MLLVLCAITDTDALWLADRIRKAGIEVAVVTGELLAFARKRSHRLGCGGVATSIELGDGTTITDENLTGVLNRLDGPPAAAWMYAAPAERDYAMAELHAFTLSWLSGLRCPVRNRPTATCLAGPAPHPWHAATAARRAGLAVPPLRLDTSMPTGDGLAWDSYRAAAAAAGVGGRPVQLVCLDGEPVTPFRLPAELPDRIRQFTRLIDADTDLIGLDFFVAPRGPERADTWWYAGVTSLASLPAGGIPLVQRIILLLAPDRVAGLDLAAGPDLEMAVAP
jgi:hypothetical protein